MADRKKRRRRRRPDTRRVKIPTHARALVEFIISEDAQLRRAAEGWIASGGHDSGARESMRRHHLQRGEAFDRLLGLDVDKAIALMARLGLDYSAEEASEHGHMV